MNFNEILQPLIYGKKVRRTCWGKGVYMTSNGDICKTYLVNENGTKLISIDERFRLDDVTADDWELFK